MSSGTDFLNITQIFCIFSELHFCHIFRLAVDMDIRGYIHVWISDLGHPVDISMDIMLAHLLIKLNTYSMNKRENEE